jgi:hypothetical protein
MTAASQDRDALLQRIGQILPLNRALPGVDAARYYKGTLIADQGGVATNVTAVPGLNIVGFCDRSDFVCDEDDSALDTVDVFSGIGMLEIDAGDPVTRADFEHIVYALDNKTISRTSGNGARSPAGYLFNILNGKAWVIVGVPGIRAVAKNTEGPGANLTDASVTIQITAGTWRALPASTLSANRTLTLGTTGAAAGDEIYIQREDAGAYTYAIVNGGAGAGTLVTMPVSLPGGAVLRFDGTNWAKKAAWTFG